MSLEEKVDRILSEQREMRTVVITCSPQAAEECIVPMIQHIADIGNVGHSFGIDVDPDGDKGQRKSFGFDGDGSSYIEKVEIE